MPDETVVEAPPRKRRWPRRLLIGTNIFVALSLVLAGATYGYYKYRIGEIGRVALGRGVLRNDGSDDPGQPQNVLLVGSDSRKNIAKSEAKSFGTDTAVAGERSDTIIILHIEPGTKKASLLSIPRDLYVHISGTNDSFRINSAFEKGPGQLIATIKENLNIDIDHYAEVDFNGFRGIVNAVGGVNVYFPSPARDAFSGLNVAKAGCISLDGNAALGYVRSRHYEYYESGRWRTDPTGDLGRIQRQQDFIRRVLRKAVSRASNPFVLNGLIGEGVKNLTVDDALSSGDMLRLAKRFKSLEPDSVEALTLPTTDFSLRGAALLKLKQPDAQQTIDRFLGRQTPDATAPAGELPAIPASSVRVRVLNGTGAGGQATDAATGLSKAGFNVAGTGDADSFKYIKSVISYGQGQMAKAQLLQAYVGGGAQIKEDLTLRGIDLVLKTGSDYAGIRAPAPAGATTTTAPTTTTTAPLPGTPKNQGASPAAQC